MKHTLTAAGLTVLALTAGHAGTALANANTPDADCAGLTFTMPRGEEGTVVRTSLNGAVVRTDTIARQFDPLSFTIPSPDRTRPHVWTVVVDSQWHDDTSWTETVPACTTSTTVPATIPPAATTTPAPSTSIATAIPPVPITVVTPPRTPAAPVTPQVESATPGMLPATGPAQIFMVGLTLSALACLTVGWYAIRAGRR